MCTGLFMLYLSAHLISIMFYLWNGARGINKCVVFVMNRISRRMWSRRRFGFACFLGVFVFCSVLRAVDIFCDVLAKGGRPGRLAVWFDGPGCAGETLEDVRLGVCGLVKKSMLTLLLLLLLLSSADVLCADGFGLFAGTIALFTANCIGVFALLVRLRIFIERFCNKSWFSFFL